MLRYLKAVQQMKQILEDNDLVRLLQLCRDDVTLFRPENYPARYGYYCALRCCI